MFSEYKAEDYKVNEQIVIKHVYTLLTSYIKNDYLSFGYGYYHTEDHPCATMSVLESTIADKIVNAAKIKNADISKQEYIEVMKNCHISSKTWDYVDCRSEYFTKLELIDQYLISSNKYFIESFEDAIFIRYIIGLQLYSQYKIFGDKIHAIINQLSI